MPAKNSVKIYLENSYYHIYNRGAGKRKIFFDEEDYKVFVHYLKKYLDKNSPYSFFDKIRLLAYCLMPNHFHFLIYQSDKKGIVKLMRSLSISYAMYFNKKYKNSGTIFQGIYKAVLIDSDEQLIHLSRYIHLNPKELTSNWQKYLFSSYSSYLESTQLEWINPKPVLDFFKRDKENFSYKSFVEKTDVGLKEKLKEVAID
ncbi:MAG TPA: transposase [Patescibacteria group bacterium]